MASDRLDRDDLIRGINQVIEKLRAAGQPAGIRIVGGAALALRYFDRRTTTDIDAQLRPEAPILMIAIEVADENGWPHDWLNSNATQFIPAFGADPGWEVLYSSEGIVVEVASPRALLVMKLNASRPGATCKILPTFSRSAISRTSRRQKTSSASSSRVTGSPIKRSGS